MASREREWPRPHEGVRPDHGGMSGASRGIGETLEGGGAPGRSRLVQPEAALWAHGCHADPPHVIARSSAALPAAQLVAAQAWGEVHTRMTTCLGTPQVGPWPTRGGGDPICIKLTNARPGNSALSEVLLLMRTSHTMCFAPITSSRRALLMTRNREPQQCAGNIQAPCAGPFPPER
jgi:hypothetical protein